MSNTLTNTVYSNLLVKKLTKLLTAAQSLADPTGSDGMTYERLTGEVMAGLTKFQNSLTTSSFSPMGLNVSQVPDFDNYTADLKSIEDNLDTIFAELEDLGSIILDQFNYIVSSYNKLHKQGKTIASDLGDYQLLSKYPASNVLIGSDSFGSTNKIDLQSSLLNKTQCNISAEEGIVTLPIDDASESRIDITELPTINTNSNGIIGNNQQANVQSHSDISVAIDNKADTWFEYERVISTDDHVPLLLDLTINLGSSKIINFIRISPNNFGTRTSIEILDIQSSEDGETFYDIKKDILPDDLTDTSASFVLSPTTSKYAGEGRFTFTPRQAKYVRIKLQQSTSYIIATSTGAQKFRYAIGIRDVEIHGIKYKSTGEVISKAFSFGDEIKKVSLIANQIPKPSITSSIGSVKHYVSYDDGSTWKLLRAVESSGKANKTQTSAEVLDFNGTASNTIKTKTAVTSIRWKALFNRISTGFKSSTATDELSDNTAFKEELHQAPTASPFEIALNKTPVKNSIQLVDVNYGARGLTGRDYYIGVGTGGKLKLQLPFPIFTELEKNNLSFWYFEGNSFIGFGKDETEPQTIYVDGEKWFNSLGSSSSSTSKHYRFNFVNSTIEFGDGTDGKLVPDGARISMLLDEEKLTFESTGKHIAKLKYPTVADKNDIDIYRIDPVEKITTLLGRNKKRHQLKPDILAAWLYFKVNFSDGDVFETIVAAEGDMSKKGHYYLDRETGQLISYSFTSSTKDTTVSYFIKPRNKLDKNDWDFYSNDSIQIDDDVFVSWSAENEPLPANTTYASLSNLNVVPNSVKFTTPSGVIASGVYHREIPFEDGRVELLGAVETKEQVDDIIGIVSPANITRSFSQNISSNIGLDVSFSNSYVFQKKVSITPSAVGEYYVNRSNNSYTVRVDKNYSDAGSATYYFADPQAVLKGRYSINYPEGDIHFHNTTGAADTVSYRYTDYRIHYPISRLINKSDWSFNSSTNKVQLKGREILLSQLVNKTSTGKARYYQASYKYIVSNRTDLAALESYFTPILKGYGLKVLTKSRLA